MSGVTDPLADMLTRIRNASVARHDAVVMPRSKLREAVAGILKAEGFVQQVEALAPRPFPMLRITLRYDEQKGSMFRGIERVSRPGRRVYVSSQAVPRIKGGLGVAILSTSKGIMTGQEAKAKGLGGEVLCRVW